MEKHTFCTIITADYYPYAQALLHSVRKFNNSIQFNILISDVSEVAFLKENKKEENVFFHFTNEVCHKGISKDIFTKYQTTDQDAFRWSMKSVFVNYLIREKGYDKVICVDCDIFFFNDYMFLFELLNDNNFLLSPHWRPSDPFLDGENFKCLFNL